MNLSGNAAVRLAVAGIIVFSVAFTASARAGEEIGAAQLGSRQLPEQTTQLTSRWEEPLAGLPGPEPQQCETCQACDCSPCTEPCLGCDSGRRLFGGTEFLLLRPHFSEAIAFAQGTQNIASGTFQTVGRELQFDYDGSIRALAGYRFDNGGEFRLTFSRFRGDTSVTGTAPGAGQFIVDPFGNLVTTAMGIAILDPGDARFTFPVPTFVTGGDLINTNANVETDTYDLDFTRPIRVDCGNWELHWSFGVRIADIDQSYSSVVTNGGAFFARGDFSVDFIGAGPRVGLETKRYIGQNRRLSVFAKSHGTLLVGEYDVRSSNSTTVIPLGAGPVPFPFRTSQAESLTRTIPVFDIEVGAAWEAGDNLTLAAGWLFQSWHDFGTSGGQFGGLFGGADDANIMSFDALTLRAELVF